MWMTFSCLFMSVENSPFLPLSCFPSKSSSYWKVAFWCYLLVPAVIFFSLSISFFKIFPCYSKPWLLYPPHFLCWAVSFSHYALLRCPTSNIVNPAQCLRIRKQCTENSILYPDSVPWLATQAFITLWWEHVQEMLWIFWDCLSIFLKKMFQVMKCLPAMHLEQC